MRARFGLYVTAFAVLQAFSVANRTQDAIKGHSPVFALYVMHSLATPLQVSVSVSLSPPHFLSLSLSLLGVTERVCVSMSVSACFCVCVECSPFLSMWLR